ARFAADHPDRTIGVVLMGTLVRPMDQASVRELKTAVAALSDPVDRGFAREFQQSTIAQPVAPALIDTFVDESLKVPARAWRAALQGAIEANVAAMLPKIAAPALILWGTRDSVTGRGDQDILVAGIRSARLQVYEDVGHALHWEQPARVAADIAAFA